MSREMSAAPMGCFKVTEVTLGTAYAYGVFYRALHGALLSGASAQERVAELVAGVKHLDGQQIPDEQIRKRLAEFIEDATTHVDAAESLRLSSMDDGSAAYLEQALSLFGAIAIVYGQDKDDRTGDTGEEGMDI
jgi:hypothetical protein